MTERSLDQGSVPLSRFAHLARLLGNRRAGRRTWLIVVVLAHLVVAIVHGAAHAQARVPLSPEANLFVFIVILSGPLIGLALTWVAERTGAWIVAVTLAGALVFGVVNHFVFESPDHITHVDPEWRTLFAATAILLAVTEALGSGLAIRSAREGKRP